MPVFIGLQADSRSGSDKKQRAAQFDPQRSVGFIESSSSGEQFFKERGCDEGGYGKGHSNHELSLLAWN